MSVANFELHFREIATKGFKGQKDSPKIDIKQMVSRKKDEFEKQQLHLIEQIMSELTSEKKSIFGKLDMVERYF